MVRRRGGQKVEWVNVTELGWVSVEGWLVRRALIVTRVGKTLKGIMLITECGVDTC